MPSKTRRKIKNKRKQKTICFTGYGSNKRGNHTSKQFRKNMRKHHIYNCLDDLCKETNDKPVCALSRKCNRRNKRKLTFSAHKWKVWAKAHYGKCK